MAAFYPVAIRMMLQQWIPPSYHEYEIENRFQQSSLVNMARLRRIEYRVWTHFAEMGREGEKDG